MSHLKLNIWYTMQKNTIQFKALTHDNFLFLHRFLQQKHLPIEKAPEWQGVRSEKLMDEG